MTPDLRGVAVSWSTDAVRCRFVYAKSADEELQLVSDAETEMISDVPAGIEVMCTVEVDGRPTRIDLAADEWWAYLRYE